MNKLLTIWGFMSVFILFMGTTAFAQSKVSGKVTDGSTKEPLTGATIVIQGTTVGTFTDNEGNYSLEVPAGANILVVSYLGYTSQDVEIGGQSTVDVALTVGAINLNEVVVVGYGTVKKSDATGAVVAVTEKDFNKGVVVSPEQLIQGRAAGVQITSTSGEPGAGINVRIRGTSSVRGGNNPLFVVDGVPLSGDDVSPSGNNSGLGASSPRNPLNFLNPNDIASIDILKDASATAIYGSRGANGVVIITTKSGKRGSGTLNYDYSLSFANISKRYELLNREEFLAAYADFNGQAAANLLDGGADTDWQDEAFRTGITQNHNRFIWGG